MDNITGFGGGSDEISLGLNLTSNVGNAKDDFGAIDQILQQMVKDQETFNGIQNDSFDKIKAMTQEVRASAEQAQQLINIFRALRGEQEGTIQSAKQLSATYQQMNNELQKAQQTQTRMGITSPTGMLPGSIPSGGGTGPIPGVPVTQTGGSGGGGVRPPNTSPAAGFPESPDDFFGKEEAKSGVGRSPKGITPSQDIGGFDISDMYDMQDVDYDEFAQGTGLPAGTVPGGRPRARRGIGGSPHQKESYRQLSDLAWTIFPNAGYYRNMRRVRWLTRNEGTMINRFIKSGAGEKLGLALNRLGGGQHLRTPEGYQVFPFSQNEDGQYIDDKGVPISGQQPGQVQYGMRDKNGNWIRQPVDASQGADAVGAPWAWNGEGIPPIPPEGASPQMFNPWQRPNLSATGEGAAKIAGSVYGARVLKNRASNLFQEGQLFTGLTGGTGIVGALKYDLGSQLTSWFGLNPLESYGQTKQINMQNLALGYRGNLLDQANSFGNMALQRYGVDPQTSMQMFGQIVIQAGASLSDLNTSLATLAHTASTTNTSFGQLQQNVIQYSQIGGSIGLTGSQNATFATSAAQFAAGQPGLAATGANPANILDSMVGQALVAQQMGTSYLGLPGAAQNQGAGAVLKGEVSVNESLMNRIGLTKGNYQDVTSLRNSFQKFHLLMSTLPGMQKEANMQFPQYVKYISNLFSGKQIKQFNQSLRSGFVQDMGQKPGESPTQAIANAIGGIGSAPDNQIIQNLQSIDRRNKWKNVGVMVGGKFLDIPSIDKLPYAQRAALESKIATGEVTVSHVNQHGKLIKGNYSNSTMLDLQGKAPEQFGLFGNTPNTAKMHQAERGAMRIELGKNAQKFFTLINDPAAFNRYMEKYDRASGLAGNGKGSQRLSGQ